MSRMSKWISRFFGWRSSTVQVDFIVAQVEADVWQAIDGRVPMGPPEEVHGYVWARSAPAIRNAAFEIAGDFDDAELQTIIRQARNSMADRIVSQLQIYADERPALQYAA